MMPLRFAARPVVARSLMMQRRTAITTPRLGSEAEMTQEAIAQIRARVQYQKELMKTKHGIEEDVHEMWKWVNITFMVGFPIVLLSGFYSMFFDEHPHRVEGELPEFMHIRSKEFPWECSDCDFFDLKCWKKCKAEK